MIIFRCEGCNGEGGWHEYYDLDYNPRIYQECPVCNGTGDFGFWNWFWCHAPIWLVEWYGDFCEKRYEANEKAKAAKTQEATQEAKD